MAHSSSLVSVLFSRLICTISQDGPPSNTDRIDGEDQYRENWSKSTLGRYPESDLIFLDSDISIWSKAIMLSRIVAIETTEYCMDSKTSRLVRRESYVSLEASKAAKTYERT